MLAQINKRKRIKIRVTMKCQNIYRIEDIILIIIVITKTTTREYSPRTL